MNRFIVNGLAVIGGISISKILAGYILKKYRKEIREEILKRAVEYFFDDYKDKSSEEEDPVKTVLLAYLKSKGVE